MYEERVLMVRVWYLLSWTDNHTDMTTRETFMSEGLWDPESVHNPLWESQALQIYRLLSPQNTHH